MVEAASAVDLELRAGVHAGEIELRGDDIGGLAVHIASRVSAMAGPGEVLTTGTVRDLTVGSGIGFDDRGLHALKGVPGRVAAPGGSHALTRAFSRLVPRRASGFGGLPIAAALRPQLRASSISRERVRTLEATLSSPTGNGAAHTSVAPASNSVSI